MFRKIVLMVLSSATIVTVSFGTVSIKNALIPTPERNEILVYHTDAAIKTDADDLESNSIEQLKNYFVQIAQNDNWIWDDDFGDDYLDEVEPDYNLFPPLLEDLEDEEMEPDYGLGDSLPPWVGPGTEILPEPEPEVLPELEVPDEESGNALPDGVGPPTSDDMDGDDGLSPDIKPESDTDLTPDIKPESDTDLTPDVKPESDTDLTPDVKPESDTDLTPDVKPDPDTELTPDQEEAPTDTDNDTGTNQEDSNKEPSVDKDPGELNGTEMTQ